ncbi:MAG: hypothetical protein K5695_07505 [Oscillospiraceae bacterium]|nr:hypothetical protein [Oscillospiraceae bacterium]
MILNQAGDIRLGEVPVQKVCLGTQTIWERSGFMPVMTGVKGYFDSASGFSAQSWENQVEGADIAFSGNVTRTNNVIRIPAGGGGSFQTGVLPSQFTVYLIARAEKTSIWYSGFGQFLLSGITTSSGMAGIEISTGWDQRSRAAFRSQNGQNVDTRLPGNEFHVLAVSVSGQTGRCFADGDLIGTLTYRAGTLQRLWLGKRENFNSRYANEYRFMAYAEAAHTDLEITRNSAWLMQRYGVVPLDSVAFPVWISATGTQYLDTGYAQQSTDMQLNARLRIDSAPALPAAVLQAGTGLQLAYDAYDTTHPQVYYAGGQEVVRTDGQAVQYGSQVNVLLKVGVSATQVGAGSSYVNGTAADASALASGSYQLLGTGFNGRLYSAMLCDDEAIVRDLVPAVRLSDSKPGMYDFVSHVLLTNAGTGEFGYGTG